MNALIEPEPPPTGWANPLFYDLRDAAGQCIPPPPIDNACCNQHAICPMCKTMAFHPHNDLQVKPWGIFWCRPCRRSMDATGVMPTLEAATHVTYQFWNDGIMCDYCKELREKAEPKSENHSDHEWDEYDEEQRQKQRDYRARMGKDPAWVAKQREGNKKSKLKKKSQKQIEEDAMAARQRAAKAHLDSLVKPAHPVATKTASVPATKKEKVPVSVAKKAPANATSSLSSTKQNTLSHPVATNSLGKAAHPLATNTATVLATKKVTTPVSVVKKVTTPVSVAKKVTTPVSVAKKAPANMSSSSSSTKQITPAKSTAEAKSGKKLSLFGTKKK